MKAKLFLIGAMSLLLALNTGCKKEEVQPASNTVSFSFSELKAEQTSVQAGYTTKIKANATGNSLVYTWTASAGTILGSGAEVTYGGSICCVGDNVITCTVSDGSSSSTKTVNVTVTP